MYHFYHEYDPDAPKVNYRWHYVYLHGQAENHMNLTQNMNDWRWDAPDIFVCDRPMPTEAGHYEATLYGKRVVAVLAAPERYAFTGGLCGRAAFPDDEDGFRHACVPEEWR